MYQGGTYLRGLWKQKPQAWGPASAVSRTFLGGVNTIYGVNPAEVAAAFPFWSPGGQVGYDYYGTDLAISASTATYFKNKSFKTSRGLGVGGTGTPPDHLSFSGNDQITIILTIDFSNLNSNNYLFAQGYSIILRKYGGVCQFIINDFSSNDRVSSVAMPTTGTGTVVASYDGAFLKIAVDRTVNKVTPTGTYGVSTNGIGLLAFNYDSTVNLSDTYISNFIVLRSGLTDDQMLSIQDNVNSLWNIPTFRTYFIPTSSELALIFANINQSQTIDSLDLLQQSLLTISNIEQAQEIENILFSLSTLLSISGISQAQLLDNLALLQQIALVINAITQQQEIDSLTLIQQAILDVQELSQGQVIDSLTLLSAAILTIAKLTHPQEITNLSLIQQSSITIADAAQSQAVENIVLLYGDVLIIPGSFQAQASDNVSLVQQHLLSVEAISQVQVTDTITLSVAGLLEIAKIVQEQNLDIVNLIKNFALTIAPLSQTQDIANIILDSSQILAIQQLIQTQLVDVISLVQQSVLNVDEISQQQILDNIEIIITRIAGKLSVTFQLKTPGGSFTLR